MRRRRTLWAIGGAAAFVTLTVAALFTWDRDADQSSSPSVATHAPNPPATVLTATTYAPLAADIGSVTEATVVMEPVDPEPTDVTASTIVEDSPAATTAATSTTTSTAPATTTAVATTPDDTTSGPHTHQNGTDYHPSQDETSPSTTLVTIPVQPGDEECHGTYVERHQVVEQCVLDRVKDLFEALFAGTHTERMAAIRDGHVLGELFADLQAKGEQVWPDLHDDLTSRYSIWEDADARAYRDIDIYGAVWNGPDLLGVRLRAWSPADGPTPDVWRAAPVVWADDQWYVSYAGFCRFVRALGKWRMTCPKDPRPQIASVTGASRDGSGFYDPWDLDDDERLRVNRAVSW